MSYWPIVPLGSEVKFLSGGTPTKDEEKFWGGDIPWVSSAEMTQRRIKKTTHSVTQDGAKEGSRLVPPGTVLVVVRGMSLAKEFRVSISERELTFNQDIKAICPKPSVDPHFLFYYLLSQSKAIKDSASEAAHGTKKLDMPVLENWPLPIPPIGDQKKIAAVISSYDDLIENNERRITLLEKMVEEIYREWFVRLRFPGYEQSKFEKNVPIGWDTDKASEFFGIVKGKSYAGDELTENPEHMPFVTLKSFKRGGGYRDEGLKYYSGRYKEDQIVHLNDVVMAVTDMTQDRVVVGRVARIPDLGNKGAVISLDVIKLVPKKIAAIFLYSYMRHSGFGDFIKEFANGANVLHLKPDLVAQQKIVIPPKTLQEAFAKKVLPIYAQIDNVTASNKRLTITRDMLLPRLISGKLSVESLDIHFQPSMQEAA